MAEAVVAEFLAGALGRCQPLLNKSSHSKRSVALNYRNFAIELRVSLDPSPKQTDCRMMLAAACKGA